MKKQAISAAELLLTAFIWGVAFVAQSVGMDYIGPFTINCVRSIIGGLVLIPLVVILGKKNRADKTAEEAKEYKKNTVIGGICCGICLCVASCFQQFGIMHTTVGKAGFITALYIIIVPILGIFMKKKIITTIIAVASLTMTSCGHDTDIDKSEQNTAVQQSNTTTSVDESSIETTEQNVQLTESEQNTTMQRVPT